MAWPGWGQTQARWAERGEKTAGPGGEEGTGRQVCRRPGVTLGLRDPLACVPVNLGRAGPVLVGDPHPP